MKKPYIAVLLLFLFINIALAKLTKEAEAKGMIDIDQIFYVEGVSLIFSLLIVLCGAFAMGFQASHKGFPLLKSFLVGMVSFLFSSLAGPAWLLIDIIYDSSVDILNYYFQGVIAIWAGFVGFIFALKKGKPFSDCLAISLPIVFFSFIAEMTWFPQDFIYFPVGLSLLVILYFSFIFSAIYLSFRLMLRTTPFQWFWSLLKGLPK